MLSRSAIRKFEQRPRQSFDRYLTMTPEELEERKAKLPAKPPAWAKLTKRQRALFLIGAKLKRFAFFADTGEGKTFLSIALMQYFQATDAAQCFLVLVPNLSNKWEWATEGFDKHAPDVSYQVLDGSSEDKWKQFEAAEADVYIETYGGLMRMLTDVKDDTRRAAKKGKQRLVPNKAKVDRMLKRVEGLFVDESTFSKNRDALPFRLAQRFAKQCEVVFALTATPFGRDPIDLWAQMFLVDQGYTLGETMALFRQTFYTSKRNFWGGVDWKFNREMEDKLHAFLKDSSVVLEAHPDSLPELVQERRYATLGSDAVTFYERIKETMRASLGDHKAMESAFIRARQISSGFLGYKEDETGDRAEYVFDKNPKMDALEEYLNAHWDGENKFIVFHEFNFSGELLSKLMKRLRIPFVLANGKTKDVEVPKLKKEFKTNPKVKAMLLSNSWGGYGLNLQVAKYGLYYEAPISPIINRQTQRRYERQHSPHSEVYRVDFITRGTADETILGYHAEGKALWKSVLEIGGKPKR
jgi:SNF2 family DNA or RNA helicase